ncbi:MAG: MYXO-CTERM sorting domain-containing protein [Nannocystaceae bacterium]|nr:MYXO-CTERM sorting domain-containing protein [bacterium]
MTSLKTLLLSSLALGAVAIAPLTAHAIEVECTGRDGSTCIVSNDPFDSVECDCAEGLGSGSSGANAWDGFDEEMLTEVCEAQLTTCESGETDAGPTTTSAGTIGTDSATTGDGDTDSGTTGGEGSTGAASTDPTGESDSASGGGPSTDPAETTGSSASGGNDTSPSGSSSTTTTTTTGGESSGSSGADSDNEDPSGCSVGGTQTGGTLFAVFGLLLGLRRRP